MRLVELVCDLARDAAVGASYLAGLIAVEGPAKEAIPEPVAWDVLASINDDSEAFRVRALRCAGGVGGLRPECDFCPRRLQVLGAKRVFVEVEGAAVRASL